MPEYIFNYEHTGSYFKSANGKLLNAAAWITIITADIIFVAFIILYFTYSDEFLPFLIIAGIISLTLAPYLILINRMYQFTLTDDNKLSMKSVINFIPVSGTIDLSRTGRIYLDDPVKGEIIIFEDVEGNVIGKFNYMLMGFDKISEYLTMIKHRNPHINFDMTTVSAGLQQ